jgi:hypothetical protein
VAQILASTWLKYSLTFTYYKSKEEYALDEHCQGYSNVYTDIGKRLAPTFVVFETVVFEEKRYLHHHPFLS